MIFIPMFSCIFIHHRVSPCFKILFPIYWKAEFWNLSFESFTSLVYFKLFLLFNVKSMENIQWGCTELIWQNLFDLHDSDFKFSPWFCHSIWNTKKMMKFLLFLFLLVWWIEKKNNDMIHQKFYMCSKILFTLFQFYTVFFSKFYSLYVAWKWKRWVASTR